MIGAAPAFAGVVASRGIGSGGKSPAPAVTNSSIHAFPALATPAMFALVGQTLSSQNIVSTTRYSALPLIMRS